MNPFKAATSFVVPEPFYGIGMSTYKGELMDREQYFRATMWENLPSLRHSKAFLGNFNRQRTRTMLELSRNKLTYICGQG